MGVASFSAKVVSVQPYFGIGFARITPSGMRTRRPTVAEPAQPCGTTKTSLKLELAGALSVSSSTWAKAGAAARSMAARLAADRNNFINVVLRLNAGVRADPEGRHGDLSEA